MQRRIVQSTIQRLCFLPCRSLEDLASFVKTTSSGFDKEVPEGDYTALVECMAHLVAVKDRVDTTDNMFEPLKHTIDLLKTYDQEMSEEVHQLLEVR